MGDYGMQLPTGERTLGAPARASAFDPKQTKALPALSPVRAAKQTSRCDPRWRGRESCRSMDLALRSVEVQQNRQ